MNFPTEMLVPKVKSLDGVECLALLEAHWSSSCLGVFESLESVEVAPVRGDESSRISAFHVKFWHFDPFLVVNIELFAVFDHLVLAVATTNDVYIPVTKIVMSSEGCPAETDVWHPLHFLSEQAESECVMNRLALWQVNIVAGNNKKIVVRNVESSSKLELLVQDFPCNVVLIGWQEVLPLLVLLVGLAPFDVGDDRFEISIHEISTCVLVDSVLRCRVLGRPNTRRLHIVRYDVLVELLGDELHSEFLLVA